MSLAAPAGATRRDATMVGVSIPVPAPFGRRSCRSGGRPTATRSPTPPRRTSPCSAPRRSSDAEVDELVDPPRRRRPVGRAVRRRPPGNRHVPAGLRRGLRPGGPRDLGLRAAGARHPQGPLGRRAGLPLPPARDRGPRRRRRPSWTAPSTSWPSSSRPSRCAASISTFRMEAGRGSRSGSFPLGDRSVTWPERPTGEAALGEGQGPQAVPRERAVQRGPRERSLRGDRLLRVLLGVPGVRHRRRGVRVRPAREPGAADPGERRPQQGAARASSRPRTTRTG